MLAACAAPSPMDTTAPPLADETAQTGASEPGGRRMSISDQTLRELEADAQARPHDLDAQMALARALYFRGVQKDAAAVERVVPMFERLARQVPHDPVTLAYLGSARLLLARQLTWPLKRLNLCKQGMGELDRAVAAAPANLQVRYLRGLSAYYLPSFFGRAQQAADDLTAVSEQADAAVERGELERDLAASALYHHGLILSTRQQPVAAAEAWRRAIALGPDSKSARAAQRQLDQLAAAEDVTARP